jgi:hypothetical protein
MFLRCVASFAAYVAIFFALSDGVAKAEPLADKVQRLEQRLALLEKRLLELERGATPAPVATKPPSAGADQWRDKSRWRMLKAGMTPADVEKVLGEPEKVSHATMIIFWYWGYPTGGTVQFDARTQRLEAWTEP